MHPSLQCYIGTLRNDIHGELYEIVKYVTVGHNYVWTDRCNKLVVFHKKLKGIKNGGIKQELEAQLYNLTAGKLNQVSNGLNVIEMKIKREQGTYDQKLIELIRLVRDLIQLFRETS